MNILRIIPIMAFLLADCASGAQQSCGALSPAAEEAIKRGDISKVEMSAAVLAARQSKYFPGTERYRVSTVNQRQIDIMYYDARGTVMTVKRVHGRWKVVDHGWWQS